MIYVHVYVWYLNSALCSGFTFSGILSSPLSSPPHLWGRGWGWGRAGPRADVLGTGQRCWSSALGPEEWCLFSTVVHAPEFQATSQADRGKMWPLPPGRSSFHRGPVQICSHLSLASAPPCSLEIQTAPAGQVWRTLPAPAATGMVLGLGCLPLQVSPGGAFPLYQVALLISPLIWSPGLWPLSTAWLKNKTLKRDSQEFLLRLSG